MKFSHGKYQAVTCNFPLHVYVYVHAVCTSVHMCLPPNICVESIGQGWVSFSIVHLTG